MNASPSTPTSQPTSDSPLANGIVSTSELIDYSNWSANVRQQMLKALKRRQKA